MTPPPADQLLRASLRPQERRLLDALRAREWSTDAELAVEIWAHRKDPPEEPERLVRVYRCHLRRKLASGWRVVSIRERGLSRYGLQRHAPGLT